MNSSILIVDDHEVVRKSLRSLLSGHSQWTICGEAVDGLEAIEKAKSLRPDVVLMDISMPRMNGLEATRVIRKELPDSKVVIVSQNDPTVVRKQAQDVNATACLVKSNLAQDLIITLDRILSEPTNPKPDVNGNIASQSWLMGGGEMGRRIREFDWSSTPLGPLEQWPQSLKTSISLILNSQHPMWVGWGPDITFLYNDAYIQILSLAKHPQALGAPTAQVWSEIWDFCGPLAEKVFQKGEATFVDDVRLFMNRGVFVEETYYSFSYSPIRDESGKVGGLFCPSTEVTPKFLNARRLQTLSELSANALIQKTIEAACLSAIETVAKNPDDVPFAILYLSDESSKTLHLQKACGITPNSLVLAPDVVEASSVAEAPYPWPLAEVVNKAQSQVVPVDALEGLPLGSAQQRIKLAMVLPLTAHGESGALGALVCGVSPARRLDAEYLTFFELLAGQVTSAIQNARATEEEKKRLQALAEVDRAKTLFFSNVSHEFRTPLTLMLGPVEELLARSHTDLTPAAKSQLELVNRNGGRLLRLVNTLLDFSRIEAGRIKALYLPTDLAAFTADLASVFRSATDKAGLKLELNLNKLSEPVYVDRDMWEKIVLNLMSNAFKFTFEGTIAVSLTEADGNAELRVRDTGVGIPAKELPRLFDRFHRIENTRSRTHEGSGIGLALVLELVKIHGGTVRAESSLGKGSTFIATIPLGKEHLAADRIGKNRNLSSAALGAAPFVEEALRWLPDDALDEIEEELPANTELLAAAYTPLPHGDPGAGQRPSVLIADDNADMRRYLTRLLAERYEVRTVPDGQAALHAAAEKLPDLILSDVMMPNLDGFGLLRQMRSDAQMRTIPIILLSARAGEESRVEGMEQGADDYLIKPFSARELLARVQTHLEMARVRKQGAEALSKSEERATHIVESITDGFMTIDEQWRITYVNPRAKAMFESQGKDGGELEGKIFWDQFPAAVNTSFEQNYRRAMSEKVMVAFEALYPAWQRWLEVRLYPSRDGISSYFLDVTERKQVEAREREMTAQTIAATAKFRAVFDQTPVFAGITHLDGTLIDANRLCLDGCGYRAEEVLGKPLWSTPWWRRSEKVQSAIRTATEQAAAGSAFREIFTYHWADGTERLVDFALHPIRDDAGHVIFLHPTGIDITDLKQAEEDYRRLAESLDVEVRARTGELEQRNVEVEKQADLLRQFSRRLLNIQDEERRKIARELHDSAGQLLAALSMNLARVAAIARQSNLPLTVETEDSQQLAQQLSQEIRTMSYLLHPPLLDEMGLPEALRWYIHGLTERSGLEIELDVSQDFVRLAPDLEVAIFRLVQESLTNIHRHSGSKTAKIHLSTEGREVRLEVQDQGKGMTPEKLAEIQSRGSGVGLRGVRERVNQFMGQMNIESNGDGTKLTFIFPFSGAEIRR